MPLREPIQSSVQSVTLISVVVAYRSPDTYVRSAVRRIFWSRYGSREADARVRVLTHSDTVTIVVVVEFRGRGRRQ